MKNPDFTEKNRQALKEKYAIFRYFGRMEWVKLSDSSNLNFSCVFQVCLEQGNDVNESL